jgi:hypothetical protein
MTKITDRSTAIKELEEIVEHRAELKAFRDAIDSPDEDEDDFDDMYEYQLELVKSKKYINPRQPYRTSSLASYKKDLDNINSTDDNQLDNVIERPWLTEEEFLQKYRMSRTSFDTLLGMVKDHPVFEKKNKSGRQQAPPATQLMTLLKYLGTEGSGNSNLGLRDVFLIGRGTVQLYRHRAMTAVRSLRDSAIKWPDKEERQEISKRIQQDSFFPNCVGFIDGTLFPLAFCPSSKDAPDYSGRKHAYSLSVMIVNDDQRMIRYYLSGWPGSSHDNRVWSNSDLCQRPKEFFSERQYLLGDSAYENSWFMVSSYKCPKGMELARPQELFNAALAKPRISAEHTIGMLKGRFPWLRSIRMKINENKKSLKIILKYIDVCVILHNLLIQQKDPVCPEWLNENDLQDPLEDYKELNVSIPHHAPKDTRRQQLTNYINEQYVWTSKPKATKK